jgi:hypothetical protein
MRHPRACERRLAILAALAAGLLTALAATSAGEAAENSDGLRGPQVASTAEDVKAEWKRQHDAMLTDKGVLRPTDKLSSVIAADRQATAPLPGDAGPVDVVLRRTGALLADLRAGGAADLAALAGELEALKKQAAGKAGDYALYERACDLRRRIAFANPLLKIDAILFARCRFRGMNMTDMACGHNAVPEGSALCVLRDPFGPQPRVVDLLKDAVVQSGRYRGRTLQGGQFCSPDLSYDGKTIYFAWTEKGGPGRSGAMDKSYNLQNTYKIFAVGVDGGGLVQLTDGAWNDTDPVELPSGRIAFVSGRRNTTIRCNYASSYAVNNTLFSMDANGSGVVQLSWHETGEWAPSVGNDGMLVYTRWDYVDRQFEYSHGIWTCFPDGRDPRAPHGNYPGGARDRPPAVELGLRAVPGRQGLYVASTGGRHQTRGTLILIDTSTPDDRGVRQLKVITAELGFGWRSDVGAYATPWPLSEKYFLAAVSHQPRKDGKAVGTLAGGLCYVDVFGNRELLCSGGEHECLDPIPLRPRPRPPLLADQIQRPGSPSTVAGAPRAAIVVANVYDSDFAWPADTRIRRLRVIQIVPKTTLHKDQPRIGFTPEAGPRIPLGTVPVMEDGSAYFEAPVGRELYFQALDANGLAVQSMRSGTYVHPGERRVCAGCHENKWRGPAAAVNTAALLAVRNAPLGRPSEIEPELTNKDGQLEVLTFPRHIQPILSRRCVSCHLKEGKGPKLDDTTPGRTGWFASYEALRPAVFWHSNKGKDQDFSQSIAGKTGSKGGKLLTHLDAKRCDAKLTGQEYRTLTLWMDCLSPFYGWDQDVDCQLRGEAVVPRIEFDPNSPLATEWRGGK